MKADPIFSNPKLASIYDYFDGERTDLENYLRLIDELKPNNIVDLGCGTGVLGIELAKRGYKVTGIDPAEASIDVAKAKNESERVGWKAGSAQDLEPNSTDLVVMTANVAQAIYDDNEWNNSLESIASALVDGGHLIFESRKPKSKAWLGWNKEKSFTSINVPGQGLVDGWVDLLDVQLPLVTFRWSYLFHEDGKLLTSDSTLIFRDIDKLKEDLEKHGFKIEEVGEAPDRYDQEYVITASINKK